MPKAITQQCASPNTAASLQSLRSQRDLSKYLGKRLWKNVGVLLLLSTLWHAPAQAFRCNNNLISEGDSTLDLLRSCGQPDFKSFRYIPGGDTLLSEFWFYNQGSNKLIQVVQLRRGRVRDITTDGRGFNSQPSCEPHFIEEGWSDYELFRRCGEPDVLVRFEDVPRPNLSNRSDYRFGPSRRLYNGPLIWAEEWQYNFGQRHLTRLIRLENGKIVDIETGNYGFRR